MLTNRPTEIPVIGCYCLLQYVHGLYRNSTSEVQNTFGTGYLGSTYRQAIIHTNTQAQYRRLWHIHAILMRFSKQKKSRLVERKGHSCRRSPPLWRLGKCRLTDRHSYQSSHSIGTQLSVVCTSVWGFFVFVFLEAVSHPIKSSRLSS